VHATAAGAGVLLIYSGRADAQQHAEWSARLDSEIAPGGVWSAAGTRAGILDLQQPVLRSPRALPLRTRWGDHDLDLHPAAFCQVNTAAAGLVVAQAAKWSAARNFGHVWDLYGGYGALGMAAANGQPLAVFDVSPCARDGLKQLSALAGNPHAKFVSGDLLRTLPRYIERIADNDLVILDPPRSGAHAELLRRIGASRARQVWYLSCNPARLARDLLRLRASGFTIDELQPFDLFPQTPLTEVFVRLRRT
jgi:23S rRNA (uracil1939-C5)-methyltransferase